LIRGPPIYEWDDYVNYVFKPVGEAVGIIRISIDRYGGSSVEIKVINPEELSLKYPDTYPYDTIPGSAVQEAMLTLSRKLNFVYIPSCLYTICYILSWEPLRSYTPIFHNQYVKFLAETIEKHLYQTL